MVILVMFWEFIKFNKFIKENHIVLWDQFSDMEFHYAIGESEENLKQLIASVSGAGGG